MRKTSSSEISRRTLLQGAAFSAATILPAATARAAQANEKVSVGIIGTGGRGKFVGKFFFEHPDAQIVAVHDYFRDRANSAGEAFGVPESMRYVGIDGYKTLLEQPLDAVVITSPPYFHPDQVEDALAAGKHVYLAKPIAVDVPGCLRIEKAAEKADGKLSVLVDFQTRNQEFFIGAAQRVHERFVGEPVLGQFFYHGGRLQPHADDGGELARLRNWVFDKALSGDIIVEQNVHVLDVATWYLESTPLKAYGTGGRKVRTNVGDCWDHFAVTYQFPNGVPVAFSSTQFSEGWYSDLCMRLHCSEGVVESHYGGIVNIRGSKAGWRGGETNAIYKEGASNNVNDFVAAILAGRTLNNAKSASNSTLTGVLGRIAAYEQREVTWDEMMKAATAIDAKLSLPKDGAEMVPKLS
jgi:predicted dehydrogenase